MAGQFQYDVFLSHNSADKPRVRRLAERWNTKAECRRQSADLLHPFPPVGLERSPVGRGNLPFRDPANAGGRFIPLPLADAHHREEPVAIFDLESS
jgi:hypothetical protein